MFLTAKLCLEHGLHMYSYQTLSNCTLVIIIIIIIIIITIIASLICLSTSGSEEQSHVCTVCVCMIAFVRVRDEFNTSKV